MPRTTFRARPSRAMSAFAAVFGIGIAVAAGASGAPGIFVLAALAIVAVHLYNTFSPRGIAHTVREADTDDAAPPRPGGQTARRVLPLVRRRRFGRRPVLRGLRRGAARLAAAGAG